MIPNSVRLALALLAGAGFFAAGWAARGKEVQTVEVPTIVTKTETQVQTQVVDHVQRVIVKQIVRVPGGTTTEKVTETDTQVETKATKQATAAQSVQSVPRPLANWSVGVDWTPRLSQDVYKPTGVEVGRRVVGDVWATGAVDWNTHSLTIGARLEF